MKIAGLQKNSFVDFPGKVSAVVFTPGCNMNCFYCHNKTLISTGNNEKLIDTDEVFQLLLERKGFLDGVVVSGGEPTVQKDLEEFLKEVKGLGYPVKLDTNGTNPQVIESLIKEKLVDYIAMDIKAPFDKYEKVCGMYVDLDRIKKSIGILKDGAVDYEFRTTVALGLDIDDIHKIAKEIIDARLYVLQNYRSIKGQEGMVAYSPQFIVNASERIKGMVRQVETRGIAFCA